MENWDIRRLSELAKKGEGVHLEFKKKANFPDKIAKELVAFANTQGGILLLGVDDDGTISGTRDIEGEVYVLEQAIQNLIWPKLDYAIQVIKLNEKKGIAVFEIERGKKLPLQLRKDFNTKTGKAYVRAGEQSLQASKEMREILRRRVKEKDTQFVFGEKERKLMELLESSPNITLTNYAQAAKLSKFVASRTLIKLVLANVLDIQPAEGQDLYFRK
ncbi:putative DNA-binding protein [Roseivirga ehrenbergii]|uniref:2OG-Fe(II) oxygenase n=1 Tax=Roseivirga ehrenbergii (strain DSM 102268 / JCM 13514 / KCTC 12282 / NCIMB 14502 / KMM 6017) TaxID=279360 RepID=A0A150XRV7_ROSEK|nr:ATP-binding protein [Roseivirga ehrenbergii]KYG81431.1 2OG-Fe(II) oxygenase [Roseivirga ehrenbergii]TCL10580.1 putative DNA-binding protein [Roseivirga ehrenbergii]